MPAKSFAARRARTAAPTRPRTAGDSRARRLVENVLIVTATPPASEMPNTAEIHSGRFVIITPTRAPLPDAASAKRPRHIDRFSHNSAYVQRVTRSAAGKASASRSPYIDVTSRRNPGSVSAPSPGSSASGGPETIESDCCAAEAGSASTATPRGSSTSAVQLTSTVAVLVRRGAASPGRAGHPRWTLPACRRSRRRST